MSVTTGRILKAQPRTGRRTAVPNPDMPGGYVQRYESELTAAERALIAELPAQLEKQANDAERRAQGVAPQADTAATQEAAEPAATEDDTGS